MQAALSRAGTALPIVVSLPLVLTATDTLSESMSATFPLEPFILVTQSV